MKNKAFQILCIFCIILSLSNCSKEKNQNIIHVNKNAETLLENEFIIRGTTFSNNLNNAYIYKVESDTLSLLDTIVIKEKAFTYKGIAKQPEFYAIKVDASDINYKFLVDASEINMFLNTNLFLSSTSSNSEVQKVYASYRTAMDAFYYKERELFLKYKSPQTASKRTSIFNVDLENLQAEKIAFVKQFIETNYDSEFIPFVLKENYHSFSPESLRKLHDTLSKNIQKLPSVKLLNERILKQEKQDL